MSDSTWLIGYSPTCTCPFWYLRICLFIYRFSLHVESQSRFKNKTTRKLFNKTKVGGTGSSWWMVFHSFRWWAVRKGKILSGWSIDSTVRRELETSDRQATEHSIRHLVFDVHSSSVGRLDRSPGWCFGGCKSASKNTTLSSSPKKPTTRGASATPHTAYVAMCQVMKLSFRMLVDFAFANSKVHHSYTL